MNAGGAGAGYEDEDGNIEGGWSKGTQRAQVREEPKRGEPREEVGGFGLNRNAMGKAQPAEAPKVEDKKPADEGPRRPMFTRGPKKDDAKEDGGFISRGAMGQKKEEDKKETSST
jgi:hypothetical protein